MKFKDLPPLSKAYWPDQNKFITSTPYRFWCHNYGTDHIGRDNTPLYYPGLLVSDPIQEENVLEYGRVFGFTIQEFNKFYPHIPGPLLYVDILEELNKDSNTSIICKHRFNNYKGYPIDICYSRVHPSGTTDNNNISHSIGSTTLDTGTYITDNQLTGDRNTARTIIGYFIALDTADVYFIVDEVIKCKTKFISAHPPGAVDWVYHNELGIKSPSEVIPFLSRIITKF